MPAGIPLPRCPPPFGVTIGRNKILAQNPQSPQRENRGAKISRGGAERRRGRGKGRKERKGRIEKVRFPAISHFVDVATAEKAVVHREFP